MNKHTPAPYLVKEWETENYKGCEITDILGNTLCQMSNYNTKANSNLIAAAPELLEALEYFVKCHTKEYMKCEIPDAIQKAESAIKKATK